MSIPIGSGPAGRRCRPTPPDPAAPPVALASRGPAGRPRLGVGLGRHRGARTGLPSDCSTSAWSRSPASWTTRPPTGSWPSSGCSTPPGDRAGHLRLSGVSADLGAALTLVDALDLMGAPVHVTCLGTLTGPGRRAPRGGRSAGRGPARDRAPQPNPGRRTASPAASWRPSPPSAARQLRRLQERMAAACGRPVDEIAADMRAGRLLTAQEAQAYGPGRQRRASPPPRRGLSPAAENASTDTHGADRPALIGLLTELLPRLSLCGVGTGTSDPRSGACRSVRTASRRSTGRSGKMSARGDHPARRRRGRDHRQPRAVPAPRGVRGRRRRRRGTRRWPGAPRSRPTSSSSTSCCPGRDGRAVLRQLRAERPGGADHPADPGRGVQRAQRWRWRRGPTTT